MFVLIKNEFAKFKREKFLIVVILMSLMPVVTGFLALLKSSHKKTIGDLFFFIINQYSMFFPMVLIILIGSIFYIEYKNKTYINLISYDYSKTKLFLSKCIAGIIMGVILSAVVFIFMWIHFVIGDNLGKVTNSSITILEVIKAFALQNIIIIPLAIFFGAIVIVITRNIIATSLIGVAYGFLSILTMGTSFAYRVPTGFAYRLCMSFIYSDYYFQNIKEATIVGSVTSIITIIAVMLVGIIVFNRKRKIES